MLTKGKTERDSLEIVSIEMLVPQDHLLCKIDRAVDFAHIYDFTESLYCADNGRPGIDPVVLFKMALIQHLYGLLSLRRTMEEISMNIAYRCFLGYSLNEPVPHFVTISYNFSTAEEIDTKMILEKDGKTVAVPKCRGRGVMDAYQIDFFSELAEGFYGILEPKEDCRLVLPQEIDFAALPCAACDRKGYRLGHGGGYYDRYLMGTKFQTAVVCREKLL